MLNTVCFLLVLFVGCCVAGCLVIDVWLFEYVVYELGVIVVYFVCGICLFVLVDALLCVCLDLVWCVCLGVLDNDWGCWLYYDVV